MLYQLNYSRNAHRWLGKTFTTVEDAIVSGIVTLFDYFDDKSNHTENIFGIDIGEYYGKHTISPIFTVAELNNEKNQINPIRDIDLMGMMDNNCLVSFLFDSKNPTVEELTTVLIDIAHHKGVNIFKESELFYNVVSLFPLAQNTMSYDVYSVILPELYTSLMMLADKRNIKIDYLNFNTKQICRTFNELGTLAHGLQYDHDVSNTIMELISVLIVMTEVKWKVKLSSLLLNHIKELQYTFQSFA